MFGVVSERANSMNDGQSRMGRLVVCCAYGSIFGCQNTGGPGVRLGWPTDRPYRMQRKLHKTKEVNWSEQRLAMQEGSFRHVEARPHIIFIYMGWRRETVWKTQNGVSFTISILRLVLF